MRRREVERPAEIPGWILGQGWQAFDGSEAGHRQDAWEAACRRWAREHGVTMADLRDAITEHAEGLLPGGHRVAA